MTPDAWPLVARLFDAAADLGADDRAAFLDREAPSPEVRAEVERLLALDEAAGAEDALPPLSPDPPPPTAGPWRLATRIGEGGMGEVWRAERADGAFEATAAVKLVRPGLAPDLVARFRAERHVLARLDHPGIARLIDGGVASDGRPYLALEYVGGEPITAYCDRERLDVAARLRLFGQVCDAVAYAHRALVVHRDLKPSNVLVCDTPDGPRVKLLDFGIAKLLDGDAASFTVPVTAAERRVMTPEYAAPEQVRGEAVTTATDVYAIGVLLYELLTGSRPYRLTSRVRAVVERAILEEAPTEPSTAVVDETAAAARSTAPERLRRRLRGDLDQIVLTALRKEPERRYGSADALGRDLERHLAGLPVEARPESVRYRVGKFVRRHRAGVAVAVVGLMLIVVGVGAVILQSQRVAAERDRAEAVTELLVGLFDGGGPNVAQGDTLTALALLDAAAARLDTSLAEQPALRAALHLALARIFLQQGAFDRADSLLRPALHWQRQAGTPADLARTLSQAAEADAWLGRYREAADKHREGLALETDLYPDPHPAIATRLNQFATVHTRLGDYPRARALTERALAHLHRLTAPDSLEIAHAVARLAVLDGHEGHYGASVQRHRRSLAILERRLGARHPDVVMARRDLARAVSLSGRPAEAASILDGVHRANVALYGDGHPTVGNTLNERSRYRLAAGDLVGAETDAREGVRSLRALYGDDHQYVANGLLDLAAVLSARGRRDEARARAEEALAIHRATLGEAHPFTAVSHAHVARLAARQGDVAAAVRHERQALRQFTASYGASDVRTDSSRARLARWSAAR